MLNSKIGAKNIILGGLGVLIIGFVVGVFFLIPKNDKPQPLKNKKPSLDMALGERARLKGVEYTIEGFKNDRLVHIKAKKAVAKDAKVMPFIKTSLKQILHLKKVSLRSVCKDDEVDVEIEAKKGEYNLQKKRMKLSDLQKARFFDKSLHTEQLSLILDTDLQDIKIITGPFSIRDNSDRIIKRGRNLSGFLNEIF